MLLAQASLSINGSTGNVELSTLSLETSRSLFERKIDRLASRQLLCWRAADNFSTPKNCLPHGDGLLGGGHAIPKKNDTSGYFYRNNTQLLGDATFFLALGEEVERKRLPGRRAGGVEGIQALGQLRGKLPLQRHGDGSGGRSISEYRTTILKNSQEQNPLRTFNYSFKKYHEGKRESLRNTVGEADVNPRKGVDKKTVRYFHYEFAAYLAGGVKKGKVDRGKNAISFQLNQARLPWLKSIILIIIYLGWIGNPSWRTPGWGKSKGPLCCPHRSPGTIVG